MDTSEPQRSTPPHSYAAFVTALCAVLGTAEWFAATLNWYRTTIVAVALGTSLLAWAFAEYASRKGSRAIREWWPLYAGAAAVLALSVAAVWQLPLVEVGPRPKAVPTTPADSEGSAEQALTRPALELNDYYEARNNVRVAVLTALGGAALFFTWLQGEKRHRLDLDQRRTALFSQAADRLRSDSEVDRAAALFVLGELMDQAPGNATQAYAMLGAFVVESILKAPQPKEGDLLPSAPPSTDVALELIAKRAKEGGEPDESVVRLSGLKVRNIQVQKIERAGLILLDVRNGALAHLARCGVRAFHLEHATLRRVEHTRFKQGLVKGGDLQGAVLTDVVFEDVCFVDVAFQQISYWSNVEFLRCIFYGPVPPESAAVSNRGATVFPLEAWS